MSDKEFNEYMDKITEYTKKVSDDKVSPKESLDSLIKAGIYDKNKKLNKIYKTV